MSVSQSSKSIRLSLLLHCARAKSLLEEQGRLTVQQDKEDGFDNNCKIVDETWGNTDNMPLRFRARNRIFACSGYQGSHLALYHLDRNAQAEWVIQGTSYGINNGNNDHRISKLSPKDHLFYRWRSQSPQKGKNQPNQSPVEKEPDGQSLASYVY